MKRLPIPARFHEISAHLGVSVRHYINNYAVRDDYLSQHEKGEIELTKEERDYLINLLMERNLKGKRR